MKTRTDKDSSQKVLKSVLDLFPNATTASPNDKQAAPLSSVTAWMDAMYVR